VIGGCDSTSDSRFSASLHGTRFRSLTRFESCEETSSTALREAHLELRPDFNKGKVSNVEVRDKYLGNTHPLSAGGRMRRQLSKHWIDLRSVFVLGAISILVKM